MIRLVLLGPPGSGKGTQAERLSSEFGLTRISTGDILRAEVTRGTELGMSVKGIMEAGDLVPDSVVLDLVSREMESTGSGYVLDGFPRTVAQAEGLDGSLENQNTKLDLVIALELEDQVIVDRLRHRRSCPTCGAVYNLIAARPRVDGVCDACGSALVQRDDDKEETIRDRLRVYRDETEPLKKYYAERGILKGVDGRGGVPEVYERVKSVVAGLT